MANVKVLLSENIEKLGDVGDIVTVKAGYARNYLLPRGIGCLPTIGELKRLEKKRAVIEKQRQEERNLAEGVAERLKSLDEIEIFAKAGEAGKLFGAITTKDIIEVLKEKHNIEIPKKQVLLRRSLSEVGEHTVKIKLHSDLTIEIKVHIKQEEN